MILPSKNISSPLANEDTQADKDINSLLNRRALIEPMVGLFIFLHSQFKMGLWNAFLNGPFLKLNIGKGLFIKRMGHLPCV